MRITATIVGQSPILLHNPQGLAKKSGQKSTIPSPEEEAAASCYWLGDRESLAIPSWNVYRSIITASAAYKVKRRSLSPFLCGSVRIEPEFLSFGTTEYSIDTRRAVVQRNGVMRSRARLNEWRLPLNMVIEEEDIPINRDSIPDVLRQVVEEAGRRVGLGDFRLERRGPFGKFAVSDWKVELNGT
jgi:hypothetical protein